MANKALICKRPVVLSIFQTLPYKKELLQGIYDKVVLENFTKFTEKQQCQSACSVHLYCKNKNKCRRGIFLKFLE